MKTTSKPRPRRLMHSGRTIRGKVERFIKRNLSPQQLQALYDVLTEKEKLQFLTELLPYILAKPSAGQDMDLSRLTDDQVDHLYTQVMEAARQ